MSKRAPLNTPLARAAGLGLLAIVGGSGLMARFAGADVFWPLALLGLPLTLAALVIEPRLVRTLLRPSARSVGIGLLGGVLMVAATHGGYRLASALVPSLGERVRALYLWVELGPSGLTRLVLLTVIILAEEVVWRGVVLERCGPHAFGPRLGIAAFGYAAMQLGSGSALLVLAAFGCGLLFGLLRRLSGDLVAPLLSHLVWDLLVLLLLPLRW